MKNIDSPKFKIGDRVVCIVPDGIDKKKCFGGGYKSLDNVNLNIDMNYGGAGWKEGLIGEIVCVETYSERNVYWINDFDVGIYETHLKKIFDFKREANKIRNERLSKI